MGVPMEANTFEKGRFGSPSFVLHAWMQFGSTSPKRRVVRMLVISWMVRSESLQIFPSVHGGGLLLWQVPPGVSWEDSR